MPVAEQAIKEALQLSKRAARKFGSERFPSEVRKEILEKLMFNEPRREMMERAEPSIESLLAHPAQGRTYIHGSFVSPKEVPSDIDLAYSVNVPWGDKAKMRSVPKERRPILDALSEAGVDTRAVSDYKMTMRDPGMQHIRDVGRGRYGKDFDWIRILGLGGALGVGAEATQPDEAEAGLISDIVKRGIGNVAKQSGKSALKEASSSEAVLKGQTVMGKIVSDVKKGAQDWRHLIFEDGTEMPVKKDVVTSLCREFGTKRKMAELADKPENEQLMQAIKSLDYHTSRQKAFTTQSMRDDYRKQYIEQMKQLGVENEDMVHITNPIKAFIPKKYADILEQAGVVKLGKRKKQIE